MACISITIPYDPSLGKNAALQYRGGQQWGLFEEKIGIKPRRAVVKKSSTKKNQDAIALELRGARNAGEGIVNFRPDKLTVWIHVARPKDPRIDGVRKDVDPVNFQPFILDAVQEGIDVDDSFYESRVTWEVAPKGEKGSIAITVFQEDRNEDHESCIDYVPRNDGDLVCAYDSDRNSGT